MSDYELYIDGKLTDVGRGFTVRLDRQLINPGELNTKDAQKSYGVTLPPTQRNRETFKYVDVEEVSGKFSRLYGAELYAKGVPIFSGKFRLSEIKNGFKGNLYNPAPKSVKDIFGDLNLNQVPAYPIGFGEFAPQITFINNAALTATQKAIFPYVLYGLLPKVPADVTGNDYTGKTIWDDTVRIGLQDIPPSPNVLGVIRHLFESQSYAVTGSAFADERLNKLYLSYKNPADYVQPWNYGLHAYMKLNGTWDSLQNQRPTTPTGTQFERGVNQSDGDGYKIYSVDLLDSTNCKVEIEADPGGNVLYREVLDDDGVTLWARTQIRIPASGFYKVRFHASMNIRPLENYRFTDPVTGVQHLGGFSDDASNSLDDSIQEVRLVRDRKQADFGLQAAKLDGTFYRNNQPQNDVFNEENSPKYFPQVDTDEGQLNFVDLAQNKNHVLGFSFGMKPGDRSDSEAFQNPKGNAAQMLAAKPALSWNSLSNDVGPTRLAVSSPGWWKYGRLDDAPTEGPNWEPTSKYEIVLDNVPSSYAKRAQFEGAPSDENWTGEGDLYAVVWFDAGELVSVASVAPEGRFRTGLAASKFGWVNHSIKWDLEITPFRVDAEWLKVDLKGNGTAVMDWDDAPNFETDTINLAGFLPSNVKVNDFIEEFVKAFNLRLAQVSPGVFSLDVKQTKTVVTSRFVDLDRLASVRDRGNTPLNLPSAYKVGFAIDLTEEGYFLTQDDGGGYYSTGAEGTQVIEQKSFFSFNWFKEITKGPDTLVLPVISKHEVWQDTTPYLEGMLKRFTDQGLRFWYFDGLLDSDFEYNGEDLQLAKVSNALPGASILNYKNSPKTILRNYFTLLINAGTSYTEIELYLTPTEYNQLDGSFLARFNSDLYFVAELNGYDPIGRNKTTVKLIRAL